MKPRIEHRSQMFAARLMPLMIFAVVGSGCAYLQNRANDLMDPVQVGITVTDKLAPDAGLFIDFFSLVPTGFSSVDGKVLGIGNRQIGWLEYRDHSWGVVVWGSEKWGTGKFNPKDPHQARPNQANETDWPVFYDGVVRLMRGENPPPLLQFFMCDRILHVGWLGIHARLSPLDVVDFLLGWTTLDLMGDDLVASKK